MSEVQASCAYVSEKISKIRWIPNAQPTSDPTHFLTGGWGFNYNAVTLWNINEYPDGESNEFVPKCLSKINYLGDITGLEFVGPGSIAVATSDGYIGIVNVNQDTDSPSLKESHKFEKLHQFSKDESAPCTAISVYDGNIASVGEDGRLKFTSAKSGKVLQTIENIDSISITAVTFINPNEVLTGNRMGVIKIFDTQTDTKKPQHTLHISCQNDKASNSVNWLSFHPTKQHIILGGSEEGSITIWDLRRPNYPANYFTAHSLGITELAFHRTQPSKAFTASENGELWLWDQNSGNQIQGMDLENTYGDMDPWLNGERASSKFNVTALVEGLNKPITSFDVINSKVICGCDNEAVYFIENIF